MSGIVVSLVLLVAVTPSAAPQAAAQLPAAQAFQEASRLQNAGKFAEAAGKWRQFLHDHPGDPAVGLAYQGLGACLLATGDWPASIDALNQALKRLPKGESGSGIRWNLTIALYRQADASKSAEHRHQAAKALEEIEADKQSTNERRTLAQFYLGRIELALGKTASAQKRFEQLLKTKGTDKDVIAPATMALAGVAEQSKDWARTRDLYRDFLRDFPDHPSAADARLGLADALMKHGEQKEAEQLFDQLAHRKGLAAADYAHFRWAELAELRGEPKIAVERWTSFLEKHASSALRETALRRAGEAHLQLKQYAEAAPLLTMWLKENPAIAARGMVQVQLGEALVQLGKYADAEQQFKSALPGLADDQLRAHALLGAARCATKLNRPSDAVKFYAEVLQSTVESVNNDSTKMAAVDAAFSAGDEKHGVEWTDRMVKTSPKGELTSRAQLHAARFLTEKGKYDASWQRSRWVLDAKVAEAQPPALYLAGFCAMKLRKFDDAVSSFQALLDQYPKADQAPMAGYSLGLAFESMGALSKALTSYRDLLKRYPDHAFAAEARKRIQILLNNR